MFVGVLRFFISAFFSIFFLSFVIQCDDSPDFVATLPGWNDPLSSAHYAGYIPIDNALQASLFYWFIKGTNETSNSTIVWFNGGPGCSSLVGGFIELGPYRLKFSEETNEGWILEPNPHSWNNVANLLIIDQPVGTGYSVVNSIEGLSTNENQVSEHLYSALCYFFGTLHPELRTESLFLIGESYAGKYIPATAQRIIQGGSYIDAEHKLHSCISLNLKGIAIGDGLVDPINQRTVYPQQAYANGFINSYQYLQAEAIANNCKRALLLNQTQYDPVTLTHPCLDINGFIHAAAGNFSNYDIRRWDQIYNKTLLESYLNNPAVKEAFHVNEGLGVSQIYASCNNTVHTAMLNDIYISQKSTIEALLSNNNLRFLFYNGQFDLQDGPIGTEKWIETMNWGGLNRFIFPRLQWIVDGNVAGYVQNGPFLTFLTMVGAGHFLPSDQSYWASQMVKHFINEIPFAEPTSQFTNHLCSFLSDCGGSKQGSCIEDRCVCNSDYAGLDCSFSVHQLNKLTDKQTYNKSLTPLTWEYYTFTVGETVNLEVHLQASTGAGVYIEKGSTNYATLNNFIAMGSILSTSSSLIVEIEKGDWNLGVYNGGTGVIHYRLDISAEKFNYFNNSDTDGDGHSNSELLAGEKSALVWVIVILSGVLFVMFMIVIILLLLLVKRTSQNFSHLQTWQEDL